MAVIRWLCRLAFGEIEHLVKKVSKECIVSIKRSQFLSSTHMYNVPFDLS